MLLSGTKQKCRIPHSDRAAQQVQILAQRHPHTKFVSIVGDKCIPNLPDARLPMIIIYRKGEVLNQLVAWGADRERKIEGLPTYDPSDNAPSTNSNFTPQSWKRFLSWLAQSSRNSGGPLVRIGTVIATAPIWKT